MKRLAVIAADPDLVGDAKKGTDPSFAPTAVLVIGDAVPPEPAPAPVIRWRQPLFPAADDLFGWEPGDPAHVLVVGGHEERRAVVLYDLEQRGRRATGVQTLNADALEGAGVVVLLGEAIPPVAPAVLAAGRVLVAPRSTPDYGLLPGIDHLAFDDDSQAAAAADAAATAPDAFAEMRIRGRLAAQRHRASTLYSRLLVDLELAR